MHVGFIYNYFADQFITEWSVSVWVKRTGDSSGIAGVINNGDCIGSPSFDIHVGNGEVSLSSIATDGISQLAMTDAAQILQDDWEHLTMVYDGTTLTMFVNGVEASSIPASGNIENTQCAMNIGAMHAGTEYFQGYMDDIYIYRRALTADEVTAFANQ
uniref:LamG-like jellyroll fold domain-containing protein n=1 Tax=Capitella teleta TaxID=283909 RepID=X1ZZF5_CAPTE